MRLMAVVTLGGMLAVAGCKSSTAPSGPTISITEYTFSPDTMTVKVGTTVTWVNNGTIQHTTTSDSTGKWNSGLLSPPSGGGGYGGSAGGSFQFTFRHAGIYGYHCTVHPPSSFPNFTGKITVTP